MEGLHSAQRSLGKDQFGILLALAVYRLSRCLPYRKTRGAPPFRKTLLPTSDARSSIPLELPLSWTARIQVLR